MPGQSNKSSDWRDERTELELANAIWSAEIRGFAEVKIELAKIKERKKALDEARKLEEEEERKLAERIRKREDEDPDNVGGPGKA